MEKRKQLTAIAVLHHYAGRTKFRLHSKIVMTVRIKRIKKDIETINAFNATPGYGVTRPTFSPEYHGAVTHVVEELKKTGAEISICRAGNIRGRIPGSGKDGPAIMMGSHLDTVAHGGQFDGVVGVVTALEAARIIVEDKITHRLPVDVVIFTEEEGSRFGRGLLGSSVWTGQMETEQLASIKDDRGVSYPEAMAQAGLIIDDHSRLQPRDIRAMLEVHIEQGAVLEKRGHRIGLVEAIAGIRQLMITIKGTADHAGTTPMEDRSDPLQAAARAIIAVDEIARNTGPNTVATVGRIACEPAQVNVIPGLARFSVDVRNSEKTILESAVAAICQTVKEICVKRGLVFEIVQLSEAEPVALSKSIIDLLEEKAREINVAPYRMISGAGHDTALVAKLTEAGMIFVPSRDGLSHCPQEYTRLEDIALGCEILLATVVQLA
jgi:allantoate deiminase